MPQSLALITPPESFVVATWGGEMSGLNKNPDAHKSNKQSMNINKSDVVVMVIRFQGEN